jgi:VWFA-related protein
MRRHLPLGPFLILVLAGLVLVEAQAPPAQQPPPAPQTAQPQRPIFRSDANFVTVDAYPLRDGKVVEGLTAANFVVEEDGQPQTIESFEFIGGADAASPESTRRDPNTIRESQLLAADARTRAFVVYLDITHVSEEGARASRSPLITMLNGLIGDNDLVAVASSYQAPRTITFGRKLISIEDMLTRHWGWGTRGSTRRSPLEEQFEQCFPADNAGQEGWVRDGEAMRPVADVLMDRSREDATMTQLEELVDVLGMMREGRTSVVLFTEGWRLFSDDGGLSGYVQSRRVPQECTQYLVRYGNMGLQTRFRELIARANRSNVTFYPVNPSGVTVFDQPISQRVMGTGRIDQSAMRQGMNNLKDRADAMHVLGNNTDGFAVSANSDLKAGLQRIVNQLRAYYLLGYYSTNRKFDGKTRRISVKVNQPGIDVKARKGYVAPTEADRAARAAAAAAPAGATGPSPVAVALDALARIRPSAELFVHAGITGDSVTVVAEVSGPQLDRGALAKGGTLEVTLTGAGGAALGTAQADLAAAARGGVVTLPLPAGTNAATVSAKVRAAGATFEARTEVARETGTVLGAPRVYRATPSSRSPLLPVAGFDFRRTERVHVEWPIAKALDARTARLLGRNGQPVAVSVTLTERDVDGRLMLALDALLAPLAPGDYVIEITATSGGVTETRLMGIRVGN